MKAATRVLPIRVFVEGAAARGNKALVADAKRAFSELVYKATGARVHIAPTGSRSDTYRAFCAATGCQPLLLVDSEAPVTDIAQPWAHLKSRDGWDQPVGAADQQAHLMVQVMETWLLADPSALQEVFGLDASRIPQWPRLEQVAKVTLNDVLARVTGLPLDGGRGSLKSKAFAVLARVRVDVLAAKCPAAARFFESIRALGPSSVR